jgi:hypothetical protein
MCLVVVAVVQPNLVWCVQANGQALVEFTASFHSQQSTDAALPGACIGNSFGESCDGCLDIPISFVALSQHSPATDAAVMAKTPLWVTVATPCKELPLTLRHADIFSNSYPSDRHLTDISSTILLI